MLFTRVITAIALAMVSLATAQTNTTGGDYYIDPDSVPISTRDSWCTSQTASCPLICLQVAPNITTTEVNDCNATALTYTCVCGNGLSPNASEYSNSLPYFICSDWGTQCVTACATNDTCASACRQDHPCGAIDPVRVNVSSSSSSEATTSSVGTTRGANVAATTSGSGGTTTGGSSTSAATATASAAVKSGDVAVLEMGEAYGLLVIAASLFGGFAFFL
ncbi:hypothetical protein BDV97DRAFT_166770 [Delphinella strobiligena]|nr:hypothetical protein BDV97DRAFT_166770 [Delphinella strobiligena]